MATSQDNSSMDDVTLCSICFEKFKTPRILPCTHSFCHGCLSSYIISVGQSMEPRLGFNCPLCREYIPSPGSFNKPNEWAGLFPLNEVLVAIVRKPDEKLCDACLRDNENESAIGLCLSCTEYLCKMCTTCHTRNLFTRQHTVCQLNEIQSGKIFPESRNIHNCPEHKNETIKFSCNDHQQACCAVCIGTKHRKCENVETVEDAAKHIKQNGKLEVLLGDVKVLEKKLTEAKGEQEKSLAEVENSADEITTQTEREFKELVDHLETLKNKHLEIVAGALKKGREKLSHCINVLTDGIQSAKYCCRNIEKVKETDNNTEMVMTYYRMKEKLLQLNGFDFTKKQLIISETKSRVLKEVRNMESFGNLEYSETNRHITYNVNDIALSLVSEFNLAGDSAWCGNVLSNGTFAVANCKSNDKCFIYSKDWKSTEVIDGLSSSFEVIQVGEKLLVTCVGTKSIEVFSASDLQKLRSINVNEYVRGITKCNGAYYVACGNKILKIDMFGKKLKEYKTQSFVGDIYICATRDGHLVFSNYFNNIVTAITDQGDTVWKYTNPRMKEPCGLEIDSVGNIFVAARESDNIHVLSGAGSLVRIIEDIPKPVFITLMEEKSLCCVCSDFKTMKMYKL